MRRFPLGPSSGAGRGAFLGPAVAALLLAVTLGCASPAAAPPVSSAPAAPASSAPPPAAATAAPAPLSIVYASTGLTWSQVPLTIAEAKGFFAAEQLAVDANVVGQSSSVCQQLVTRAVDLGNCSLNDMIQAVEISGAPLVLLVNETVTALNYAVMARPQLQGWSDLRGKAAIVGSPKDNTVYFFRTMARANGLADDDYDFQYAGASNARYAALTSGAVDASILTDPFDFQAEREGYARVDDLIPRYVNGENYVGPGGVGRRDWAQEHAEELVRYTRAFTATVRWIYDPANKAELLALMGPKLNISGEALERTYQRTIVDWKQWSADGRIKDGAIQGVLGSLVELGFLSAPTPPPSKFYDMTYVERAQQTRR
jgi:NitT/TauT family transport system substrate-binding protein